MEVPFPKELRFTARSVSGIEEKTRKSLAAILSEFSLSSMGHLVSAGIGVNFNNALDTIDGYFQSGGDMGQLFATIARRLKEQGFLPKGIQVEEMATQLNESVVTSPNLGETPSQTQSE